MTDEACLKKEQKEDRVAFIKEKNAFMIYIVSNSLLNFDYQ